MFSALSTLLPTLEDLSSGSDDEYFDVHPLPGYFCVPSPQVSQDCQKRNNGGLTHVAHSNGQGKHSLIIGPSWKCTPLHSQSLPAVNKIPCLAKMGNANIPPPVAEANQEMQSLRTHKKYPAPPPPVSREPSFVSMNSLNSKNSLYGSQNAQLGISLSASAASVNTLDSVSTRKKPHRSPSLKKYPAPQPPINSNGDTVTFKTNSLSRNHNWRNSYNSEITQFNNSIAKTISENPIPVINYGMKRPGSPLPYSSTTLPVRLKPNKFHSTNTRTTPFIQILKHSHLPPSDQVSPTSLSTSLPTEGPTVDFEYLGIAENLKFAASESNLEVPEKTTLQLLENNSHYNSPCSDNLAATPLSICGNVKFESEKDDCVTTPDFIEFGVIELKLNNSNKNLCNSGNKRAISIGVEQLKNFNVSLKVNEIRSEKLTQEKSSNQGLELSNCEDLGSKGNLVNMRIREAAKNDAFDGVSVTDKTEDKVACKESAEECGDKPNSKRISLVIKESLDIRDNISQSRRGSISKDSISSRGSRETSVSSTSSDNIDPLSRNTTDRFFIKRSKSGKLAALASMFESEDKNEVVSTSLKSNISKNSGKFTRNKIAGLANIFVGDAQNKETIKLQSPYSKPFSPESSISEKVKTNIGGIDVSKFGAVATNIKDFRPHKKLKDEIESPTPQNDIKSKIKNDETSKLKGENSKSKNVGKPNLKESKNSIMIVGSEKILNGECMESKSKDTADSKTLNENKSEKEGSSKNISNSETSTPLSKETENQDLGLAKKKKKKRAPKDASENDKTKAGGVEISPAKVDPHKSVLVKLENENVVAKNADILSIKEINVIPKSASAKVEKEKTATCCVENKKANAVLQPVPTKLANDKTTIKNAVICSLKDTNVDLKSASAEDNTGKTATGVVELCSVNKTNADLKAVQNKNTVAKNADICCMKETNVLDSAKIDKENMATGNVEICPVKEINLDVTTVPVILEVTNISSLKEPNVDLLESVSAKIENELPDTKCADICPIGESNVDLLLSALVATLKIDAEITTLGDIDNCSSKEIEISDTISNISLDGSHSIIKQNSYKVLNDKNCSNAQDSNAIVVVKPSFDGDNLADSGSMERNCLLMCQVDHSVKSTLTSIATLKCENLVNKEAQQPVALSNSHNVDGKSQRLNTTAISNSPSSTLEGDAPIETNFEIKPKRAEIKVLNERVDLTDTDKNQHLNEFTSNATKESKIFEVQKIDPPLIPANPDSYPTADDLKNLIVKPSDLHLETNLSVSVSSSSLSNEKPVDSSSVKLIGYMPSNNGSEAVLNLSEVSMEVVEKLTSSDAIHDILQAEFNSPKTETLPLSGIETSIPAAPCNRAINLEPMPAIKVADVLSQSVLKDVSIQIHQMSTHTQKSIPYIDSNISPEMSVAAECVEQSQAVFSTTSVVVSLDEISLSAASAGNDIRTDAQVDTRNNLIVSEFAKMTSSEPITDKSESPISLLCDENIPAVSTTNFELKNTSNSQFVVAMEVQDLQPSCITIDSKSSMLPNLAATEVPSPVKSFSQTSIQVSTEQLMLPPKVNTDVCISRNVNNGILEDATGSSVGLFQGMVNSLKTSFSKVMLHASSNSSDIDDQGNDAIIDKSDSMPEKVIEGSSLETFVTENTCFTSPNSSSPEYQSASSSTHTISSVETDLMKNDFVNDMKIIVGSETGARSKKSSSVSVPEEVLNVSEILREAEERLTRALEKDPLVYRFPIGKADDVYVDAFDPSQFDILMPLPTPEDRMLLDRRSRSSTPYREGHDRRSPTPNRIVEQTEALLSETDRILRKTRSHNSLRRSYARSLSGVNLNRLAEVTTDLTEEHSTSHFAGERIEAEQAERMRLEKEVNDLQSEVKRMTDTNDKLEMERLALRTEILHVELNGDTHDSDDAADAALYKRKYEWSLRELEVVKKQLKQQQEDDLDQLLILKKQLEKKIYDSHEETEEQRQVATQLKKKSQRLQAEMNDMKILLEEQTSRNNLLEKKQRKFDQDVHVIQEELRNEKLAKDKIQREKDQTLSEKYSFEQEVTALKLELDLKEEKVASLTREINDLNFTGKAEDEVAIMKKAKHDLELRVKDQEEELDDLAGQVQMLESARLRLEMSIEQMRKENRKEAQLREEEMEEVRVAAQKKVKAFEAQLESEHDERTQLMREKHELERRLALVQERTFSTVDEDAFHKVKKELKKTKALLKDTQTMLEKTQSEGSNKLLLRQLKTQLEDAEFAKTAAIKARQSAESEVAEIQSQLEEALRMKNDAEERCVRHSKEKTEMQTQLEEGEEEVAEVMKKYKATVSQLSIDQINISEQSQMIAELEHEKQVLQERLSELSSKVEVLEGETANIHTQRRLQMKIKELESKLELESTTRQRLESQITRLKDQVERLCSECDSAKSKETQTQDFCKKLNRQLREAKEDLTNIQQKHTDATSKKQEVEKQLELAESEIITLKSDLKLAFKRIEDLQQALQGDLSDSDTELTDSDSESETSLTSYLTASATQDRPLSNSTARTTEIESSPESKMMELMVCSPTADLMSSIREDVEDDYKESFA